MQVNRTHKMKKNGKTDTNKQKNKQKSKIENGINSGKMYEAKKRKGKGKTPKEQNKVDKQVNYLF